MLRSRAFSSLLLRRLPSSTSSSSSSVLRLTRRRRDEKLQLVRLFCGEKKKTTDSSSDSSSSFEETLKKMREKQEPQEQNEDDKKGNGESEGASSSTSSSPSQEKTDYVKLASHWIGRGKYMLHQLSTGWGDTWKEMISGPTDNQIKKTVGHASVHSEKKKGEGEEAEEEKEEYTGPQAIVVTKGDKSAWEQMQDRLQDSPLIQEMLKNTRRLRKEAAGTAWGQKATQVGSSVQDRVHDAREFWETSQNPLVYKISGAWEALTAPTEEGMAIAAIQKLDPDFVLETWAEAVKAERSEECIRAHLEGNLKKLKPITGEGVYNKLAADIRTRKHDGIQIDTNILQMDELQVLVRMLDQEGPIILTIYMVQQINCIRNRAGEIIEGGESQVIAKYYTLAYKQVFSEEDGVSDWKIVDYHMEGSDQYY